MGRTLGPVGRVLITSLSLGCGGGGRADDDAGPGRDGAAVVDAWVPGVPTDCTTTVCHYVRADAAGAGTGADWTDAYPALPDELARGATYFVADGAYPSYTFDDPERDADVITIKKATAPDHGTEAGWVDAHGDGQATFAGSLAFARDHYVVDGATRNEADWLDAAAYGLHAAGVYIQNENLPPGADHITLRYLDLGGPYSQDHTPGQGEAVYLGGFASLIEDVTVSHCFLHNWSFIQCAGVDGITVEHTAFAAGWAKEAFRGQTVCRNGVLRHNLFYNASQRDPDDPTSGTTADIAIWDGAAGAFDGWAIHGNVIWNDRDISHCCGTIVVGGDGTSFVGAPASDVRVHNNTIVGIGANLAGIQVNGGSGNEVSNNLWADCAGTVFANPDTAANGEVASDPFVDAAGFDFHLRAALAGTPLPAPYDRDLDGTPRGVDGVFDRGAFEFDAAAAASARHGLPGTCAL